MDWLEEAKKIYNEEPFSETRKHNPIVKSLNEIPDDLSQVVSLLFTDNISSNELIEALPALLASAPNLQRISISSTIPMSWADIASLPLGKVEKLSFSCSDVSSDQPLLAPNLKSLTIWNGSKQLLPLELLTAESVRFNFSGCPKLETLSLNHFQLIDPADFRALSSLKKLVLNDTCLDNLDWLKDATYQLEKLNIGNSVTDCSGLFYQPQLKELYLSFATINDTAPIESLKGLKRLELYNCNIRDDAGLQAMDVEHKSFSAKDRRLDAIRR